MRVFAILAAVITASILTGTAAVTAQLVGASAQAVANVVRYVDTWNIVS